MGDVIIRAQGVGKRYRIGGRPSGYRTLRDSVAGFAARSAARVLHPRRRPGADDARMIWALRDIDFEVRAGEVVGTIGRNGAGKSTLLKILSRITEPTAGYAEIVGRVGSLLEVGTGFHPELTGRENVFLNGAILGMKRREIEAKFDEIVAFAEIEPFIDTPVKHYSSGMYLRLAFGVAAHLEPEILMVDEVLAVGDASFQRKCLGKMRDVARGGRTVLFVSHNMAAVQSLCQRALVLREGRIVVDAPVDEAVGAYLRSLEQATAQPVAERGNRGGAGRVRLVDVAFFDGNAAIPTSTLVTGRPARVDFTVSKLPANSTCGFTIYDQHGQPVACLDSAIPAPVDVTDAALGPHFVCEIDELPLVPGRYRLNVAIVSRGEVEDHLEGAAFFDVEQGRVQGRPVAMGGQWGNVHVRHRWRVGAGEEAQCAS